MLITLDNVLSAEEVRSLRAELDRARWIDGRASAGSRSGSVKRNLQLGVDDPLAIQLGEQLLARLRRQPRFISAALPQRILAPRFNRYTDGGEYGIHVDAAIMPAATDGTLLRSDLSATLFLSEPDEYDGGELQVETPFGAQPVKLPAGSLVLYPSSSLHRVTPVTRGARVAAFLWLQSLIRDDGERSLLFELDQRIQSLAARCAPDDADITGLTATYHNLLRRWAIP